VYNTYIYDFRFVSFLSRGFKGGTVCYGVDGHVYTLHGILFGTNYS